MIIKSDRHTKTVLIKIENAKKDKIKIIKKF